MLKFARLNHPRSGKILRILVGVWFVLALLLAGTVLLQPGAVQRINFADVRVVPPSGYRTVVSPLDITIHEILVSDGSTINKGEPILSFITEVTETVEVEQPAIEPPASPLLAVLKELREGANLQALMAAGAASAELPNSMGQIAQARTETITKLKSLSSRINAYQFDLRNVMALVAAGDLPIAEERRLKQSISALTAERSKVLNEYTLLLDKQLLLIDEPAPVEPVKTTEFVTREETQYLYSPYSGNLYFVSDLEPGGQLISNQPLVQVGSFTDRELGIAMALDVALVERLASQPTLKLLLTVADNTSDRSREFWVNATLEQVDPPGISMPEPAMSYIVARTSNISDELLQYVAELGPNGRYSAAIELELDILERLGSLL